MLIDENDIKNIMGKVWDISPVEIPSDVCLNDFLQWDSLGHVALLVALEEKYSIDINYKVITELTDITAIIKYLEGK